MSVAAIYDIHGNLPALEAVLAEVEAGGVDAIVVGGDVVPGPMCRDVLDVLDGLHPPVEYIQGNGEADILAVRQGDVPTRVPDGLHDTLRWVADGLRPDQVERMARWPATTRRTIAGLGEVLFCHATPRDDNEIFTRLTPVERLRPVFHPVGGGTVVCGHTHMQFDRQVGGVRIVNAGSVGMPFGEPGAYWALLGPGGVELRRTGYDVESAAERIRASGYPGAALLDPSHPPTEEEMLHAFEEVALRG